MTELKTQEIIKLSDREHVLKRSDIYLGSSTENEYEGFYIENDKFIWKKVKYIEGLLKIINEIIDNAVDEGIRTNFKFANKIKITIEKGAVTVLDNGRGIPVTNSTKDDEQPPVLAFCHARAGSNFGKDEERVTAGKNGVGSFITAVFSNKFEVKTSDGKLQLKLKCKNNLDEHSFKVTQSIEQFTEVYFEPDLKRFGINSEEIPAVYLDLIKQRLINLSMSFQDIKFWINGEAVRIQSAQKFIQMFNNDYEIIDENKNWFVAALPNDADDMRFYTFCNGLHLKEGGSHIQYISYEIANTLRDKLVKRYKDIKPGDIRNKLMFIIFFNNFKNMKFDSQTKVKLTNGTGEINDYLGFVDWEKFALKIYKNEKLIDPIIEIFKIKEEFKHRQELKALNKNAGRKIYNEKYLAPIEEKKYLTLCEGDSAQGGISQVLGRKQFGYFALRGKPLNTLDVTMSKIVDNEEIKTIVEILNLNLADPNSDMDYQNILIASDADCLSENTLIQTKNSVKKIKDIEYGDEVLTHTGEYKKVINIIQTKKYKKVIINSCGKQISCSDNHKLLVFRDNQIQEIRAFDIKTTDKLLIKKK